MTGAHFPFRRLRFRDWTLTGAAPQQESLWSRPGIYLTVLQRTPKVSNDVGEGRTTEGRSLWDADAW